MKKDELPPGWVRAKLGELCLPVTKADPRELGNDYFKYVDIRSIDPTANMVRSAESVAATRAPSRARQVIGEGDILFSTVRPMLRKIARVGRELDGQIASTGFLVLRPSPHVSSKFLFYTTLSEEFNLLVASMQRGVSYPSVRPGEVLEIPIALPPRAEQERIVDALEDHLSRLDSGRKLLEAVSLRLGKLQRKIAYDLTSVGRRGSRSMTLGSIATRVKNGIFVSRPGTEPSGVPILRISAVRPMALNASDIRYSGIEFDELANSDSLLRSGNLLFIRYNGNPELVGCCAVVRDSEQSLTYPDKLIRVDIDPEQAIPEFVALACNFGAGRQQIRSKVKTTAGQAGISGRELKSIPLLLPEIEVQKQIVSQYSLVVEEVQELEQFVSSAIAKLNGLRAVLLQHAFSGKLIPQDTSDEPAFGLLERIKVERSGQAKPKRSRASKRPAPRARIAPSISSDPAGTFVQEELGL